VVGTFQVAEFEENNPRDSAYVDAYACYNQTRKRERDERPKGHTMNTALKIVETMDGKFVGQVYSVSNGNAKGLYETPEYFTREMAYADANCWDEFHGTPKTNVTIPSETEFTVDAGDTVYGRTGSKRTGEWFAAKLSNWIRDYGNDVRFECFPFSDKPAAGFHLDVFFPNGQIRKFAIFKH
jgi:hypothetical protein